MTGALHVGFRVGVFSWLRKLGALPRSEVSRNTDLLIVGTHYLKDDRNKIRDAKRLGVTMLSEAAFRRKYAV